MAQPTKVQQDPNRIETDRVQYWRNGVMITAMMSREAARQAVRDGVAFVISGQAIGAIADGQMMS